MNYNRWIYGFRKHWKEILSFVFAVVAALSAFIFSNQPRETFGVSLVATVVFSAMSVYFLLKEKDFYYIALDRYSDEEDWFGSGIFKFDKNNKAYKVADTDAGFIFSKCLTWSNYSLVGEFKILKDYLGVIVRAVDLSNYVMLQIGKNGIRPHYYANGGFVVIEVDKTGLKLERDIKDGEWYKFEFVVNKEDIEIKIKDDDGFLIDKSWNIKKGHSNPRITIPIFPKEDEHRKNHTHNLDLPVTYDYGSFGFRSGHGEIGLVKNLLIKNL